MNETAKALAKEFGASKPKWVTTEALGKGWTFANMKLDPGDKGKSMIGVMFSCNETTAIEDPSFERRYGHAPRGGLWEGSVSFEYDFAEMIAQREACALTPESRNCDASDVRGMDIDLIIGLTDRGMKR